MPQRCQVCESPHREAVEQRLLLVTPASYYLLRRKYRLRESSLHRHWLTHMDSLRASARSELPADALHAELTVRQARILVQEREVLSPSFSRSLASIMGSLSLEPPIRDARGRLRGGNPGNSGGKPGRSGRPRTRLDIRREIAEWKAAGLLRPPKPDPNLEYLRRWFG